MNTMISHLATATNQITASVLNSLWEGLAMTLVVWFLLKICKRLNAATRYVVWCGLLAAVTALTCASVVNGLHADAKRVAQYRAERQQIVAPATPFVNSADAEATEASIVQTSEPAQIQRQDFAQPQTILRLVQPPFGLRLLKVNGVWSVFLIVGWALVSGLLLCRLVASYLHLRRLKRIANPLDQAYQERFQDLLKSGAIARSIRLCRSEHVSVPVALGLSDPVILIPEELPKQLAESELDQILLHEAGHLARRDDWSNLVQHFFVAVFPFHPAVHWISRQMSLEREIACDDRVTMVTGATKPYALCLTKLAELTRMGTQQVLASGAWNSKTQLNRRIVMLLDYKKNRTNRVSTAACAACILGIGGLLFVFSQAGQLVAAEDSKPVERATTSGTVSSSRTSTAPEQPLVESRAGNADSGGVGGGGFGGGSANGRNAFVARGGGGGFGGGGERPDNAASERDYLQEAVRFSEAQWRTAEDRFKAGQISANEVADVKKMLDLQKSMAAMNRDWKAFKVKTRQSQTDEERQHAAQLREKVSASLRDTLNNETNTQLRILALNSLVEMQPANAVELLVEIVLKDKDINVRKHALVDLGHQRGITSSEALLKLYDELEEEVGFKIMILQAMGSRQPGDMSVSGDNFAIMEKWIAKLQQIAKESPSPELKAEAIQQLVLVGRNLQVLPSEN